MSKSFLIYDSFDRLFPLLEGEKEVVVLIDQRVKELYGHHFLYPQIVVETGEQHKNLANVEKIANALLEMECSRNAFLLCVGGGILTDIGGFVASIYKRGIKCGYVPTTLLAQVDASTGGKTGVNLSGLKNILGTFSLPEFTYINTSTLKTLPHRELLAGAAEMIKAFAIKDKESFAKAHMCFRNGIDTSSPEFRELLATAIEIKDGVVERDFRESGERKLLNFGHTFGHAIEKCASERGDSILHGEAVAKGMKVAAQISVRKGLFSQGGCDTLCTTLSQMGFDLSVGYSVEKMMEAIKNDKKRGENGVDFVLLQEIGKSCVETISFDDLAKVAEDVLH